MPNKCLLCYGSTVAPGLAASVDFEKPQCQHPRSDRLTEGSGSQIHPFPLLQGSHPCTLKSSRGTRDEKCLYRVKIRR